MTARWWIPVELHHVSRGEWLAYIPSLDAQVTGTSENSVRANVLEEIESAQGIRDFSVVWTGA